MHPITPRNSFDNFFKNPCKNNSMNSIRSFPKKISSWSRLKLLLEFFWTFLRRFFFIMPVIAWRFYTRISPTNHPSFPQESSPINCPGISNSDFCRNLSGIPPSFSPNIYSGILTFTGLSADNKVSGKITNELWF